VPSLGCELKQRRSISFWRRSAKQPAVAEQYNGRCRSRDSHLVMSRCHRLSSTRTIRRPQETMHRRQVRPIRYASGPVTTACLKKASRWYFLNSSVKHRSIWTIFAMQHQEQTRRKWLDVNCCSFVNLTFILSLHYFAKWKSHTLADYNNQFTLSLLQHVFKMSSSTNARA